MGGAPRMPGGGPDPAKVYKTEQDPAVEKMEKSKLRRAPAT